MKSSKLIGGLLFALALPFAFAQQGTTPAAPQEWKYKSPKLNKAQIDQWLAKPEQIVIIEVRRPDEVSKNGGFPVYLSIQSQDLEKYLAYIPKERFVLTASNHAGRAGAAADLLAAKGFKIAGAVGAQNYEEEGGVLLKVAVPPPRTAAPAAAPAR